MIVKNKGLTGTIKKDKEGFNINISIIGYGNTNLFNVLQQLNLIDTLNNMKHGEKVTFI